MLLSLRQNLGLLLLDFFAVFNFSEELMFAISLIGIPTLISPLILCFFKVPDKFLKYYMSVAMSVLIGMFGCFNDIGIYITFVLVPVASCLYFDVYYTDVLLCFFVYCDGYFCLFEFGRET